MTTRKQGPKSRQYSWLLSLLTGLALAIATSGCTVMSVHGENDAENPPIPVLDEKSEPIDAPKAALSLPWFTSPRPSFLGLALSGGGSRAANFSAASMQELDQIGILQKVNVISSVSGGGLAGAYYALNSPNIQWNVLQEKLGTNFRNLFITRWAAPWHWPAIAFTDETKTDLLARVFDDVLFSGKRYRDIPATSPIFLANATDITAGGARVTFSNDYFVDELGSSLYDMRIATAVATSAAFPGIFDSVPLERFRATDQIRRRNGTSPWPVPSYAHLIDGGASDNLGVDTLWDAALAQLYGNYFNRMPDTLGTKPCVIISVDANAPGTSARFEHLSDERSATDRIFNRNMFDAIDSLFEGRRQETLQKMGLGQTEYGSSSSENFWDLEEHYVDRMRVNTFDIPVNCHPFWGAVECQVDGAEVRAPAKRLTFQCFVWHIALDEVAGVGVKMADEEQGVESISKARKDSLVRLERLTTQIKTDWKLTGPDFCSSRQLQHALYIAAKVLVLDDRESRGQLCDYMTHNGMITDADACKREFPATDTYMPVVAKHPLTLNFATDDSHTANLPVKCFSP
jgi:NTE family protein